ncbi:protein-(glutamine-N5) methyltransferase, release factor-specific [Blastomonas sp. RAC04]|uniref:peptide chain release factor N(5)-glutamine methyltransferase n=1 Tax=Blastomonas sp. RAC04 TaxID=1842535 RepID=UPI00083D3AFC|nr:peptide chain release factor N(5)-glutamine methyltransferase [Blastomonas sp. RAC04]AOG00793.1 protein-(glutamine-N5) methyltransferase, release factor-specific [Blastomonas sp. RAC04]
MTIAEALREATQTLARVSDTPRLDAELLMAHTFGISRSTLLLNRMRDDVPAAFAALIARRSAHEPVAYITGRQDFWTLTLKVTPAVLIPRADSETLIEAAISALTERPPARILDLGTGSGALLLAALAQWPDAQGVGVDASADALAIAQSNATALGFGNRAKMLPGDWRHPGWQQPLPGPFDLIVCNPPYVETTAALAPQVMEHEPHCALFAGEDGLDDYRILIPALPALLAPQGIAILEIGAGQREDVAALATASGFAVDCRQDLAGHDRALILRPGRPD